MISNEGLQVALSPVQLAAVISDSTVTEGETWSNRLMGGAGFGGGSRRTSWGWGYVLCT